VIGDGWTMAAYLGGTSAWVNHLDDVTGSIEVGKLADLALLDRDILWPGMGPIGDTRVRLTLVEGAAVYEDPSLERR
jgi:predicted amidohydrolase YtcJ